ncbi:LLM class flavin-dependent oxidoreductase [Nocardia neocaledoniensis]|uniref:LLM class flavin-dependent oxidoreductase n=1 Tax=Nocardia neocaledoniensis TaxID=236511 RepID=UPI002457DF67|nr:LLM class flavin-dependent oxidoreductase [Nocardia neocaledoniensis]
MSRKMHLAVFAQGVGVAQSVWRSSRTKPERMHGIAHWAEVAATAERGFFDALFVADALNLSPAIGTDATDRPDPVAVLSALSAVTDKIGLIGTSSTTYNDPFTVARQFATLDHLSGGRAGWNVVTTAIPAAAENYGSARLPDHEDRYARGEEFVDVVKALWDGWEPDAIVADRESGRWTDRDKIHRIDHKGEHFAVAGPLTIPRSPQGQIPLAQAGSSSTGMKLGARVADLVFTTQHDLNEALDFADRMRGLAAAEGRRSGAVKVLPGITPIIGETDAAARDLAVELGSLIDEQTTLKFLEQAFGDIDLTSLDLDAPFPDLRGSLPTNASVSRPKLFTEIALRDGLTVRQLAQRIGLGIGHRTLIGSAETVADDMQRWFDSGAADGFIILPADLPAGLADFVDQVVPRLQKRGLLRTEYTGHTLRDHIDED